MIPITHFAYLALALFVAGLATVVFHRSMRTALVGVQVMVAATSLLLVAYSRWWGNHEGQIVAIAASAIGVAVLVVGVAAARWSRGAAPRERGEGRDDGA